MLIYSADWTPLIWPACSSFRSYLSGLMSFLPQFWVHLHPLWCCTYVCLALNSLWFHDQLEVDGQQQSEMNDRVSFWFCLTDEKEEGILGSILLPSFHISMLSVDDHINRKYAFKVSACFHSCQTPLNAYSMVEHVSQQSKESIIQSSDRIR